MSVYQKEPNSFNLQVPQKISVRNYFDKHRKKNKIADILIPDQLSIPSPQLTAKSPGSTFDHVQTPHVWKRNDNKGLKLNYNCFETTNNFKKPVERTPGYENNYRTPSTAYQLENKGVNRLNFEKNGPRNYGEVKLSLRTMKVNRVQNSGTRVATYAGNRYSGQSQGRCQTDHSCTVNGTLYNTENKYTDNDASKYSLKSYNRKVRKPQLLMNLMYEDLIKPIKHEDNSKSNSRMFLIQNSPYNSNGNGFYRTPKVQSNGCKCLPGSCWTIRMLDMINNQKFQLPPRLRNPKDIDANLKQIQRDLHRTQPDHHAFKNQKMIERLQDLLTEYAYRDEEVGYVQGMNFVGAALVYHCHNTTDALKILCYMMKKCNYRNIFLNDMELGQVIASKLSEDLRRLSFDLFSYLTEEGVQIQMFISSWYFSLCGSFVPLDSMHIIIDKFIKKGFSGINELVIALLLRKKLDLMKLEDSQLMLEFSNQKLCDYSQKIDWKDLKQRSDHLSLSPINL